MVLCRHLFRRPLPKYLASYTYICRAHLDGHFKIIAHAHAQFDVPKLRYLLRQLVLNSYQTLPSQRQYDDRDILQNQGFSALHSQNETHPPTQSSSIQQTLNVDIPLAQT